MVQAPSDPGPDLCAGFLAVLPVQHAAISTLADPFEVETVCASDAVAARLDELQIDLGEGPCWQALATRRPVVLPDLGDAAYVGWPSLLEAVVDRGIVSAYAFPLLVGTLGIGAVDLYATTSGALSDSDIAHAVTLADSTALQVLARSLAGTEESPGGAAWPRRIVHQASGMVVAQLGVSPADALLIIRAHAFATNRTVRDVAEDITARRIAFRQ